MLQWLFDGIGSTIVSIIISTLFGGTVGYFIGIKSKAKQIQKGKNYAQQKQILNFETHLNNKNSSKFYSNLNQIQKSGDNSTQVQIGSIKNGK